MGSPELTGQQVAGRHLDGTASSTVITTVLDQQRAIVAIHADRHTSCAMDPEQAIQLRDVLRTDRNGTISPSSSDGFSWMLMVSPFADTTNGSSAASDTMLLLLDSSSSKQSAALDTATIVHTGTQINALVNHLTESVAALSQRSNP